MLQKLKKRRFLLYLGALLFALNGVFHPLFHMLDDDEGCCGDPVAAADKADSGHSRHDHDRSHHDSHCPVCAGLFSSAEVPDLPELPVLPEPPPVHIFTYRTPFQSEFTVYRQERAPPVLS